MQQSNTYVILFTAGLTILIGGIMSMTSIFLKPLQDKQVELDTKKKILGAVMDISTINDPNEILKVYNERIISKVVDFEGNILEKNEKGEMLVAEKVNIQKNYKKPIEERIYPIYFFTAEGNKSMTDAYIFPMFGNGLWDWISAYVAVDKDLNTVRGIAFDHKSETPGLGARITSKEIQDRYIGKKIFDVEGNLLSITMVKGEGNSNLTDYEVDGMSGATLTGKGVNNMLNQYFECYSSFIYKQKQEVN